MQHVVFVVFKTSFDRRTSSYSFSGTEFIAGLVYQMASVSAESVFTDFHLWRQMKVRSENVLKSWSTNFSRWNSWACVCDVRKVGPWFSWIQTSSSALRNLHTWCSASVWSSEPNKVWKVPEFLCKCQKSVQYFLYNVQSLWWVAVCSVVITSTLLEEDMLLSELCLSDSSSPPSFPPSPSSSLLLLFLSSSLSPSLTLSPLSSPSLWGVADSAERLDV